MAAANEVSDAGSESDSSPTSIPAAPETAAAAAAADEVKRWVDLAAGQTLALKHAAVSAVDSAVSAAGSGLSQIRSASYAGLHETKGLMDMMKTQYTTFEDMTFGKIKEGIVLAAEHPEISCGIAAGAGLVLFKRPRSFLIGNMRRIFASEESLLSDAEARVNQLRQSISLMKNESKKLEERALKAEEEMERGRNSLIKEGREIHGKLHFASKIEKEAAGLRELISELPRRDASKFQSEVSVLVSQARKEMKVLNRTASKIVNYGIPL